MHLQIIFVNSVFNFELYEFYLKTIMQQQHPLLLYPVLSRIGSYLNFPELLILRQVCLDWKQEADIRLTNKINIHLKSDSQLRKYVFDISSTGLDIATSYKLESISFESHQYLITWFLDIFGKNVQSLNLQNCSWKSVTLRHALFKKLPNLTHLEVFTDKDGNEWLQPLLPMSFLPYGFHAPLVNLRGLKITGDYSQRTDLFYDILKSSNNLETIHLSKYHPDNDDLFGTWLLEIIFSCDFPYLKSLEVGNCTLIQMQIDSLALKQYPLKRLSIDLESYATDNKSIDKILGHFLSLESVEFGFNNL